MNTKRGEPDTVTVRSDRGTFTAVEGGEADPEVHREALRRRREWKPSGGWTTAVESSTLVDGVWRYVVSVTNDRVLERVEIHIPERVTDSWAQESREDLDTLAGWQAHGMLRGKSWSEVQKAAESPTEIYWTAHPPDRPRSA